MSVDGLVLGVLGLALGGAALVLARRWPHAAVIATLAVLCLVPVWIGVKIGFNGNFFLPAVVLACLAVAAVLTPVRGFRLSPVDVLLGFLIVLAASSLLTSEASLALSFLITPFTYFVSGYALGRIATARLGAEFIYGAVAVMFTLVAVLVIVEFVTGVNLFARWHVDGPQFEAWGEVQERGGLARAEGAFGHPIALGTSLALVIPLTLASKLRFWVRLAMVMTMLGAIVLTFSRAGMLCGVLGIALSAVLLRRELSRGERAALVVAASATAVALLPLVVTVFTDAGLEAEGSAAYRAELLPLLERVSLLGFSDVVGRGPDGSLAFSGYQSIDSQLVLTGLTTGLLALIAVVIALGAAVVLCVRGRATPATIAVVAHLPALLTVALITQYSVMLWLVVGVAATTQLAARRSPVFAFPSITAPLRASTTGD